MNSRPQMFRLPRVWTRPNTSTLPADGRRPSRALRPFLSRLEDRRLLSGTAQIELYGAYSISSYEGVGFQENEVATMQASLNGQPDTSKGDFQAAIKWGDGGSSSGDFVYVGTNGSFAEYIVKGSHVYQSAGTAIPINMTVTGPGGASVSLDFE